VASISSMVAAARFFFPARAPRVAGAGRGAFRWCPCRAARAAPAWALACVPACALASAVAI